MPATVETIENLLNQIESLHKTLADAELPSEAADLLSAAEKLGPRLENFGTSLYNLRDSITAQARGLAARLERRAVDALKRRLNDHVDPAFVPPPQTFTTTGTRCPVAMCEPARLPDGHPAKNILPREELYLNGSRHVLVLGKHGQPFFRTSSCG